MLKLCGNAFLVNRQRNSNKMEEIKNQDKNDSNLSKETYQPETESGKKEQGKIKK